MLISIQWGSQKKSSTTTLLLLLLLLPPTSKHHGKTSLSQNFTCLPGPCLDADPSRVARKADCVCSRRASRRWSLLETQSPLEQQAWAAALVVEMAVGIQGPCGAGVVAWALLSSSISTQEAAVWLSITLSCI